MEKFKSPMLAKDFDRELLRFPVLTSPKIDGIRCVIEKSEDGLIDPYSRSGKIIRNKFIQQTIGLKPLLGLDGELVVGDFNAPDVYNKTSSGVMSAEGEPDFTFYVFDIRYLSAEPYHHRMRQAMALCNWHAGVSVGKMRVVFLRQKAISNIDEFDEAEADYLSHGFEGMMVRHPDTAYKFGRSSPKIGELLKVKRFAHDEAEVVGFEEMQHNGNEALTNELGRTKRSTAKDGMLPAGMLGAFICRAPAYAETFNVSCGSMSMKDRKEAWEGRTGWLGATIRFKHLPHGAKDRPRHPLFAGRRDADDIS
jgi:DNA ligase-1